VIVTTLLGTLQRLALTVDVVPEAALPIVPTPLLMVMTLLLEICQLTILTTLVLAWPSTVAVAVNCTSCPVGAVSGLAVMARLVTDGHTVTVAWVGAVKVPSVAEMELVPTVVAVAAAVISPLFVPIVATAGSEDVHIHLLVTFDCVLSSNVPVAVIWKVWPGVRGTVVGPIVIPVRFAAGKKLLQLTATAIVTSTAKAPARRSLRFADDFMVLRLLGNGLPVQQFPLVSGQT
jgi:hypothetical protein